VKFPSTKDFQRFFKRLPWWVIPLIVVLLFGRFVIVALFHVFGVH
jgi:hypothetical protein